MLKSQIRYTPNKILIYSGAIDHNIIQWKKEIHYSFIKDIYAAAGLNVFMNRVF